MTTEIISLALGILAVYSYVSSRKTVYLNLRLMKIQFILASVELLQLKYHTLQIAELVYAKAIEEDENKRQEYELVKQKIEEKFDQRGNYYVRKLGDILGDQEIRKSWSDALRYAEELIKRDEAKRKTN